MKDNENKDEDVHNKTIYVVMTIARQIAGEYVFCRPDGAYRRASKADELVKKIGKEYTTEEGRPKPLKLNSPLGEAVCFCEIGVFQLDLED